MHKRLDEFTAAGVKIVVVTQSKPESVTAPVLGLPTLCDPERVAFGYFGLERGNWLMFLRPSGVIHYLKLMLAGWRPRWERGEDLLQLAGDFIVSGELRLVYAFRSSDPTDRPSASDLLQAIEHLNA